MDRGTKQQAALYIHWPFCEKKCPYCDFNSHVRDQIDHTRWLNAYLKSVDAYHRLYPDTEITSVFFGGGTPSLMVPETLYTLISHIHKKWSLSQNVEITLEANPSSVETGKFKDFKKAGINRLSLGVQSFNDDALRFLGRLHNASEARKALDISRKVFDRYSFDLIYARPDQSWQAWQNELDEALAYQANHMSLYQLTIEEGTAFAKAFTRGYLKMPDEETSARFFEKTRQIMADKGLPAYEISNHAKEGQESIHNLAYWEGRFYIGIGPGAHGRLPAGKYDVNTAAYSTIDHKRPETWLAAVEKTGSGLAEKIAISRHERFLEQILSGLRLTNGIDLEMLENLYGTYLDNWLDQQKINHLCHEGFLTKNTNRLALSEKGMLLHGEITNQIIRDY